jgi:hypothetical protein
VSEQNILNPAVTSLFNPDFGYTEGLPETRSLFQATSGKLYSRRQMGLGRIYDLAWNNRDLATKHALQQWAQQYENDFFTLADWERSRYFSGRFDGPLSFSPAGNQGYNVKGRFIELPGLALFAYPTNWTRDAIFLEERNGFGEDLVKLLTPGNWTYQVDANAHGGAHYYSASPSGVETAEWSYFGYGYQVYCEKNGDRGIVAVSVFRVRDGVAVAGENLFDLYSASLVPSAVIDSRTNFPLDFYRVRLRVTGAKNASSSAVICDADAVQVMQ